MYYDAVLKQMGALPEVADFPCISPVNQANQAENV
jgi:hypothetical protein